jgi:hypothetical protein
MEKSCIVLDRDTKTSRDSVKYYRRCKRWLS